MKFIVFESGSRAGLSAELFFEKYISETGASHQLYMSDFDKDFEKILPRHPQIRNIHDEQAIQMLSNDDVAVFPADELNRQRCSDIAKYASKYRFSTVEPFYYNKMLVNKYLRQYTSSCAIKVPVTFDLSEMCVRPNTQSAGSRNVQFLENHCVTQLINIEKEFVVDVLRYDANKMYIFPRQVTLKNGYDRFIKLLPIDGEFSETVKEFITVVCPENKGIFSDIFHLQLCQDVNGDYYYIEFSKRISGTSFVNMKSGMSPFALIDGIDQDINPIAIDGQWHRFEDFLLKHG